MPNSNYTDLQLKIISGEIPMETVNGRVLTWLYKKAVANNDHELAEKVLLHLSAAKAKTYEKTKERARNRKWQQYHGEFQWKNPKSNEYSEHQKKIIRGEVAYEDVHTNELINIHLKAQNSEDYELSERILDLINSRRQDALAKHALYDKARRKSKALEHIEFSDNDNTFSKWEQCILMGVIDLDDCPEEELQHIIDVARKQNDTGKIVLAEKLLLYKNHPEAAYTVQNHEEAIDRIEELLQLPIRRPDTWFD